jgi:hypothetical protein
MNAAHRVMAAKITRRTQKIAIAVVAWWQKIVLLAMPCHPWSLCGLDIFVYAVIFDMNLSFSSMEI